MKKKKLKLEEKKKNMYQLLPTPLLKYTKSLLMKSKESKLEMLLTKRRERR
jgi:hypothetical protein